MALRGFVPEIVVTHPCGPDEVGALIAHMAQEFCPHAHMRLVDGELLNWYGARTAPGLRYVRGMADT